MNVQASLRPVKRRKLYEDVMDQLESMMGVGTLAPGDQLPSERELMEAFGVGRTAVREALFALQRSGLISLRNGERAYVTVPSASGLIEEMSATARHLLARPEGLREFQQARLLLECSMSRYAARHATAADLDALGAALARNEAAMGNLRRFSETDVAFHYEITRIGRNGIFDALHQASARWLGEQRLISLRDATAERAAYEAHCSIFAAVADRDPDRAERAMQDHLEAVAALYWSQIAPPA